MATSIIPSVTLFHADYHNYKFDHHKEREYEPDLVGLWRSNLLNFKRGSRQPFFSSDFDFDFDLIFLDYPLFSTWFAQ